MIQTTIKSVHPKRLRKNQPPNTARIGLAIRVRPAMPAAAIDRVTVSTEPFVPLMPQRISLTPNEPTTLAAMAAATTPPRIPPASLVMLLIDIAARWFSSTRTSVWVGGMSQLGRFAKLTPCQEPDIPAPPHKPPLDARQPHVPILFPCSSSRVAPHRPPCATVSPAPGRFTPSAPAAIAAACSMSYAPCRWTPRWATWGRASAAMPAVVAMGGSRR